MAVAASLDLRGAMAIGEEAVVADAMEAVGQGVQEEAADELVRRELHDFAATLRGDSPCR